MSKAPKIYNYHGVTGEFIGESIADADPLEQGNWLIPANAALDSAPSANKGCAVRRSEFGWEQVEDNRGPIYSTETGAQSQLEDFGPLPDSFTKKEPPSQNHKWKNNAWRIDKDAERASIAAEALKLRDHLQAEASALILPLQDAVDLDDARNTEVEALDVWKRYRVALNRIERQAGFPEVIIWPKSPKNEE